MSKDDWNEADSRKLAAMATKAIVTSNPFQNAMKGPQLGDAPGRYLGVVKPIVLYQMCRAWCEQNNYTEKPSWTTFLRALRASRKHIAFRKSTGQHGVCDECMWYKKQLQRHMGVAERNSTMEDYAGHLLRNWRDRQLDSNFHAQAGQTRAAMLSGTDLNLLQHSVMFVRSDGLDQAKHKVPRCQNFTKAFCDLIRPAMHVQMCWCHFHSVEFAIADPDLPKDSCSHLECLSRLLTGIYDKHKALARHLCLALDNTSRDNKNSVVLRFFIKLRLLQVFESIYICFPVKGHTHTCLDALGGQAVVKTSAEAFNTDRELVNLYEKFLNGCSFENGTFKTSCWKHDQSADWRSWAEEIPLKFSCVTGPLAPHGFRIVQRHQMEDIGDAEITAWPGAPPPHPNDLVMGVHKYMSDAQPYQVCLLVPAAEIDDVRRSLSLQPSGNQLRKHMPVKEREDIVKKAEQCHLKGGIHKDALDFLIGWAKGTKRRDPRLQHYSFLDHRYNSTPENAAPRRYLQGQHHRLRHIVVLQHDLSQSVPWLLSFKMLFLVKNLFLKRHVFQPRFAVFRFGLMVCLGLPG